MVSQNIIAGVCGPAKLLLAWTGCTGQGINILPKYMLLMACFFLLTSKVSTLVQCLSLWITPFTKLEHLWSIYLQKNPTFENGCMRIMSSLQDPLGEHLRSALKRDTCAYAYIKYPAVADTVVLRPLVDRMLYVKKYFLFFLFTKSISAEASNSF